MNKVSYFFKNCLQPIIADYQTWSRLVIGTEDAVNVYIEGGCYIYFIDNHDELIDMFWDGLDCFAPSNNEAGDFFTWYA